jgi:SH3 domain-containing YSC84-like protein 1
MRWMIMPVALLFSAALLAQNADRVDPKADTQTTKATSADRRLQDAAMVFNEIMATPDKGIPRDLLAKAQCAVIVPSLKKGAFIVGGKFGRGFLTCRQASGTWSAPGAIRVEGGSFGFQIGGSETDVVMLVMNAGGKNKLLSSQFTLGGEGEVAAGPVGRSASAQTDARLNAEILSWSRSRGVFGGVALTGATLRQDLDTNAELYGKRLTNREIVNGTVTPPAAAHDLLAALNQYGSPANSSADRNDTRRR